MGVFAQAHETTERVLGERRSQFVLNLSDRLRALSDPRAIIDTAQEALGRYLHANRVGYGEVEETARYFTTERNWTDGTIPSREGTHDLAGFGPEVLAALRAGVPLLIQDAATDPRTSSPEALAAFDAIDTRAVITASLVKEGQMRAALYVHAREPRPWTERDSELVTEVAERTWSAVERARAETQTKVSEERLRTALEIETVGAIYFDLKGRLASANDAFLRKSGYSREDLDAGQLTLQGLTPPERQGEVERTLAQLKARGQTTPEEKEYIRQDGSRWWALCASKLLPDGTAFKFVLDITDRKAVEAALLEETRTLETLNRTGEAVAGELDLEPLIQLITDAGVELTGAQFGSYFHNEMDETGERLHLFTLSGADREHFIRMGRPRATGVFGPTFRNEGAIRSGDIMADPRYGQFEPHRGMPNGHLPVRSYLAVSVVSRSGEVLGGLIFGHPQPDRFTERHERLMLGLAAQAAIAIDNARLFHAVQSANETLEQRVAERTADLTQAHEALRQAQKMEAVGQLTGGIAHDFNNLLAGISGSLEAIERRLAQGRLDGLERFIKGAQSSSQRAAALTQRLLAFARRQTLDPKPTDVNRLVFGMEELIRRTVGPDIAVEVVGAAGLWLTRVDAAQLESALLNLAINARDAMPEGGRLTIETANKWLDERASKEREIPSGQYLSLCVTDTGTGMPMDVIQRIFDPFFTTKPLGKGTGLGLSMVHGFVRQSGGQVRVYSEVGQGTTMCLYLPRYHGELSGEDDGHDSAISQSGTGETVLVIDDEPTVRMLIVEVLEEAGYAALEAQDGLSGLKILQSDARID
ncbi:MAG TPA: GAF domain-containing protein, partial [Rubellimicrobium sp.]|nr:GAF domain-containing protein [Rubellimicrobium sp.]